VRRCFLGCLLVCALFITACGGGNSAPANTPASVGTIRALTPADLNADGIPDAPVHAGLRRLLLQVPADFPASRVSLVRGGRPVDFESSSVLTRTGEKLIELMLAQPLGEEGAILRAGSYELKLFALSSTEIPESFLKPASSAALANDLVNPTAAVFDGAADVQLLCSANLPSISSGLSLVCGESAPIAVAFTLGQRGLTLVPASMLLAGRPYRLIAGTDAKDSFDRPFAAGFSLMIRPTGVVALGRIDFDKDGQEDLLVLDASGSLQLLTEPNSNAKSVALPLNGRGIDLAVGDFDGNGSPDVAVLLRAEDGFTLAKLLTDSRSGRQFSVQPCKVSVEAPQYLAAGDLDRDGRDDLIIGGAFGHVLVLTSKLPHRTLDMTIDRGLVLDTSIVDADGDGDPDLFSLQARGNSRFLISRGADGFGEKPDFRDATTAPATRAAFADFEVNSRADLMLSGAVKTCRLQFDCGTQPGSISLARGDERFSGYSGAALARDLNLDNRPDLIVAREDDFGISADFAIFVNFAGKERSDPDAIISLENRYAINLIEYWRGTIAFALDNGLLIKPLSPIQLPLNESSKARFVKAYEPMPPLPAPLSAAVADFNGDTRADVAALDADGKLTIWLAGAAGEKFTNGGDAITLGAGSLQAIDFDRDSRLDLLFIPADSNRRPKLLRNRGDGQMEDDFEGILPTPPAKLLGAPALGDFDRDGVFDVLWPSDVGRLQFNEGNGRWREGGDLPVVRDASRPLYFAGELCCADFSGDGFSDVIAVMQPFGASAFEQYLVLFEGTGKPEQPFAITVTLQMRGRFFKLKPADFNADRRMDLAVGYARQGEPAQLTLFTLDSAKQLLPIAGSPEARGELLDMALDDIDRDGDLDLLASERIEGEVSIALWVNAGDGRYVRGGAADESLKRALSGFAATNLSLADFTGDGKPDLLAADANGNVVLIRASVE